MLLGSGRRGRGHILARAQVGALDLVGRVLGVRLSARAGAIAV